MDAYDARFRVRIRHRRDDVSCSRAGAQGRRSGGKSTTPSSTSTRPSRAPFTFVASVVDSVSSINSPSEEDEDSCDVDDNSLACQFERRANACLEVFGEEHMVLPSTGSRIRLSPDGSQLVVRQTAVERLLRKDAEVSTTSRH